MGRIIPIPESCFVDKIEEQFPDWMYTFQAATKRFEPDALCSNTAVGAAVGAFSNITNSTKVRLVKTVFISLNNNLV